MAEFGEDFADEAVEDVDLFGGEVRRERAKAVGQGDELGKILLRGIRGHLAKIISPYRGLKSRNLSRHRLSVGKAECQGPPLNGNGRLTPCDNPPHNDTIARTVVFVARRGMVT
jgi:hypothetical protein